MRMLRLVVFAALLFGSASTAHAEVIWILVGGQNRPTSRDQRGIRSAGVLLVAQDANPLQILLNDNPNVAAAGEVFQGPFKDCPHLYHYHGALFGVSDSGEQCGWGVVIPFMGAPQEIQQIAVARAEEELALRMAAGIPPDYDAALQAVKDAEAILEMLADEITTPPYSRLQARLLRARILRVRVADRLARIALERLAAGTQKNQDLRNVKRRLKSAINTKSKIAEIMARARGLLEPPR